MWWTYKHFIYVKHKSSYEKYQSVIKLFQKLFTKFINYELGIATKFLYTDSI